MLRCVVMWCVVCSEQYVAWWCSLTPQLAPLFRSSTRRAGHTRCLKVEGAGRSAGGEG